jgi:hypothetical protein
MLLTTLSLGTQKANAEMKGLRKQERKKARRARARNEQVKK